MKFLTVEAAMAYAEWEETAWNEEDETDYVLAEIGDTKLVEIGVGVYRIDYVDHLGKQRRSAPYYVWPEAEAFFGQMVAEEDAR